MDVYLAVLDPPNPGEFESADYRSDVVGVFSTEPGARNACQAHANEQRETAGYPVFDLHWSDDSAKFQGSTYVVILLALDKSLGES